MCKQILRNRDPTCTADAECGITKEVERENSEYRNGKLYKIASNIYRIKDKFKIRSRRKK